MIKPVMGKWMLAQRAPYSNGKPQAREMFDIRC